MSEHGEAWLCYVKQDRENQNDCAFEINPPAGQGFWCVWVGMGDARSWEQTQVQVMAGKRNSVLEINPISLM